MNPVVAYSDWLNSLSSEQQDDFCLLLLLKTFIIILWVWLG
jgi:hypothetical protein